VLLPIGGVAELERLPATPKQEVAVAVAGPLVNFGLAIGLALLGLVLPPIPLLSQMVWGLAIANVMLGTFNLLPAFPLDGGRVFRALIETRLGRVRATEIATVLGKVFAVGLGIFGFFNDPLLVLVAVFVWMAASAELRTVRRQAMLEHLRSLSHYARVSPRWIVFR
jgi:Zn-dependent protease